MSNKHAEKKLKLLLILPIALLFSFFFLFSTQKIEATSGTDWPMFRKDPEHSGFNNEEGILKPPLKLKWKFGRPGSMGTPVAVGDTLFVRSDLFYALDANNGTIKWSRPYKGPNLHTSPAVAGDTIYLGSGAHPICSGCGIEALDKNTGNLKWSLEFSPKGVRDPNVSDGFLYFGSDDWYVRAVNASTGQLLWTSQQLNDGVVAVPAVADGKVFVGTWGGTLYAFDTNTGSIIWSFRPSPGGVLFPSPTYDNGTLYFGAGLDNLWAIDSETRDIKWISPKTDDAIGSSPAFAYGKVFFISGGGTVYALNAVDGSITWSYKTLAQTTPSRSSPAVANGVVYVGSRDGYLYAFDTDTGEILWKYQTGGPIADSSPAVANGMLYVGSNDGYLYAFSTEGVSPTPTPTPTPTPPPFLPVPDLKQFQDPWGDDEYNHALNWSVDPTMARWGCAVTSMSMILQYYGHTTNPGGLNTWLTSQPDGYLRNGITNWLAISRYTRIQNDENSVYPVLEYKRIHSATLETLSSEITASHPIILGQPGHFIVAKGETEDSFTINDPAYTDRPTLQSYGNTFTSFGRYTVTSTDLSAILLVSDSDTEISLFDSFGNPADADSFLAEPLTDDIDGTATSGDILQVLLFQQPSEGKYLIQVDEEDGPFQLDVYLYDGEGNLIGGTPIEVSGLSQEGMPANFELNFDQDPNTPTITPETTFESTLQHLEISRNLGWISNQGIYQSLKSKLLSAQKSAGNNSKTKILTALLNELSVLKGKQITNEALDILLRDVISLLFS